MSLDRKPPGNPNMVKGHKMSQNRKTTEPKKLQVKKRLMGKWRTHPVDKLVSLANFIEATKPEMCAKIWLRLLDSCELEEHKKKGSLPPITSGEEHTNSDEDAMRLLEEMEKTDETTPASNPLSMAEGPTEVQAETSSEEDLRRDPPE